jgi:dGTPase
MPLAGDIVNDIAKRYPALDATRRGAELVRELISRLIEDVSRQTTGAIAAAKPGSADDVRRQDHALATFSPAMAATERAIKQFLFARMYRHARVTQIMGEAEGVVRDLFTRYRDDPATLPAGWLADGDPGSAGGRERRIGDFIAGMTDRFALIEHQRLFDSSPELR